jgi:hypothetical protein
MERLTLACGGFAINSVRRLRHCHEQRLVDSSGGGGVNATSSTPFHESCNSRHVTR